MEYIRYHKSNDTIPRTGTTKGVKTDPMTISFKDNVIPYKENQILVVNFKGVQKPALVTGVNDHSVTVSLDGIANKKVIRFNNIVQIIS